MKGEWHVGRNDESRTVERPQGFISALQPYCAACADDFIWNQRRFLGFVHLLVLGKRQHGDGTMRPARCYHGRSAFHWLSPLATAIRARSRGQQRVDFTPDFVRILAPNQNGLTSTRHCHHPGSIDAGPRTDHLRRRDRHRGLLAVVFHYRVPLTEFTHPGRYFPGPIWLSAHVRFCLGGIAVCRKGTRSLVNGETPMPVRQLMILLGLFCLCLALVGIAWANGNQLYLFLPSRRRDCGGASRCGCPRFPQSETRLRFPCSSLALPPSQCHNATWSELRENHHAQRIRLQVCLDCGEDRLAIDRGDRTRPAQCAPILLGCWDRGCIRNDSLFPPRFSVAAD